MRGANACAKGLRGSNLPNLTLLPLQDDEAYKEMMADTDVALITQQAGTGQYFFPSKLLSALAFARPVLAVADADSELALALAEGKFGVLTPCGDAAALARALDGAAAMDRAELHTLGQCRPEVRGAVRVGKRADRFRAGTLRGLSSK